MKIAILSTPAVALPPKGYAGIERVVSELEKELSLLGHSVYVYATGDSKVSGKLGYFYKKALNPSVKLTYNPYFFLNHVSGFIREVSRRKFDIIHFNDAGRLSLFFKDYTNHPFVTTLHGSYERPKDDPYKIQEEKINELLAFRKLPYISISDRQRKDLPNLNYISTIYNSIPFDDFKFSKKGGDYISWLGRINPVKGLTEAIEVSGNIGKDIKFFGFVDEGDRDYFNKEIKPKLGKKVNFLGESKSVKKKAAFFGASKLFLFPIAWDEPFGIVMLESMATGTPVVAYARGAAPEVVKDGVTGFLVNPKGENRGNWVIKKKGRAGLEEAVRRIFSMPQEEYERMRLNSMNYVRDNFTSRSMALKYLDAYKKVIADWKR